MLDTKLMLEISKEIKKYCESLDDPFLADVHQVLLEADVQWLNVQTFVIGQIMDNPQVINLGREKIDNWEELDSNKKITKLYLYFAESGALEEVRNYMENSVDVFPGPTPMHYEVPDVTEPYNGNVAVHWEQFLKTKVFKDLRQIFLNHL